MDLRFHLLSHLICIIINHNLNNHNPNHLTTDLIVTMAEVITEALVHLSKASMGRIMDLITLEVRMEVTVLMDHFHPNILVHMDHLFLDYHHNKHHNHKECIKDHLHLIIRCFKEDIRCLQDRDRDRQEEAYRCMLMDLIWDSDLHLGMEEDRMEEEVVVEGIMEEGLRLFRLLMDHLGMVGIMGMEGIMDNLIRVLEEEEEVHLHLHNNFHNDQRNCQDYQYHNWKSGISYWSLELEEEEEEVEEVEEEEVGTRSWIGWDWIFIRGRGRVRVRTNEIMGNLRLFML